MPRKAKPKPDDILLVLQTTVRWPRKRAEREFDLYKKATISELTADLADPFFKDKRSKTILQRHIDLISTATFDEFHVAYLTDDNFTEWVEEGNSPEHIDGFMDEMFTRFWEDCQAASRKRARK